MKFDHIAFYSKDIFRSISWYTNMLDAKILYQDDTWGLIEVSDLKIAFVSPNQHPNHICFEINDDYSEKHLANKIFKEHRDGSESCYIKDLDGNHIEFLKWPKKNG